MLKLISVILVTTVIAGGYILMYVQDRSKLKPFRRWLVLIALLAVFGAWFDYLSGVRERTETEARAAQWQHDVREIKAQNATIQAQNSLLLGERDSLRSAANEFRNTNREMTSLLGPLRSIANLKYPGLGEREALRKLADDISGMQPRLKPLADKVQWRRDPQTGLVHTLYIFRSQYPMGLRDIRIKMRFNRAIALPEPRIRGAFVQEQGTQMTLDPDSLGFLYTTGYLQEGNDLAIEVISKEQLHIDSMNLAP